MGKIKRFSRMACSGKYFYIFKQIADIRINEKNKEENILVNFLAEYSQ